MQGYILATLVAYLTAGHANAEQGRSLDAQTGPTNVRILKAGSSYQLLVDGKPFYVKGAGLEFGNQEALVRNGGNSFRTWRTDNGREPGKALLDRAQTNGLYVTMGLHVASERGGFDYDDPVQVTRQLERIKAEVLLYKDHPALLMWAIGNELNLGAANPKVWNAVNQISEMIHQLDSNHPTMTPLAGLNPELAALLKSRANSLDLIGIQLYSSIDQLPEILKISEWTGPYIVSEWGPTGHWETTNTDWGAPIEDNSSVKANVLRNRYQGMVANSNGQSLGSYVFLWGQKQERTPTWYSMFLATGEATAAVDTMHYLWNGNWPTNRSPEILSLVLDSRTADQNIRLLPQHFYSAKLSARDPEDDVLRYQWKILQESDAQSVGGDHENIPVELDMLLSMQADGRMRFKTPDKSGSYRLFVTTYDDRGHAAHANIPFQVVAD